MADRLRSWWGWGWEDQALDGRQTEKLAESLRRRFGVDLAVRPPPELTSITLPESRVRVPDTFASWCHTDRRERAAHTFGKAYRDVVRASYGQLGSPPDVVARPTTEAQIEEVLDWASTVRVAVVPYGGGSSVVGGVEHRGEGDVRGVLTLDLTALDRVLEVDRTSRAARIQAGALGPVLEDQLRPHDLTLRHFPQSFEFSTLGGWLATRAGGHYASVYTHIDDMVESMRVITPTGVSESRRLPGSGAGPSHDRLFLGSEGSLGVITEAWMRLQDRPRFKRSVGVRFANYADGVAAVRALSQSGLFPTNCRLLDATEAATSAGVTDGSTLLVVGFESAHHRVDEAMGLALTCCADHGGLVPDEPVAPDLPGAPDLAGEPDTAVHDQRAGAVGAWRNAFLRAPYTRDALVRMSVIVETFETACTWDRFAETHDAITTAALDAVERVAGIGWVTCRFTHIYPDGPAPYFSVFAPGRPGSEVAMWDEIKAAVSETIGNVGATITHHHAVGRDHSPWYRAQRTEPLGRVLTAAKATLDPEGIMNPGVIVDPLQT